MRDYRVFAVASIAAVAIATSVAAASGATNVLIGQWVLKQQVINPDYGTYICDRKGLLFTPDKFGYDVRGHWWGLPVSSYDQSNPKHIFLRSTRDEAFTVVDHNTIQQVVGPTTCIYTRLR